MLEYYEKRRLKRLLYSKPAILLLAVLVFMMGSAVWDAYGKEQIAREKRDLSVGEKERLLERKESLESELTRLSDERGLEEEIRHKFDAVKEGEEIIVLVNPKEQNASVGSGEKESVFKRIKNFFGF